jgi:hypothetical protein
MLGFVSRLEIELLGILTLNWIKGGISVFAPEQIYHGRVLIQSIGDWASRYNANLASLLKHVAGKA